MILDRKGPNRLHLFTPAKLNLFLEVLGKREDGFHEIETVMHSIDLYDELEVSLRGDSPVLVTHGLDVGPNKDNLALKAAHCFNQRLGKQIGFEIALNKRIPPGGGLGGGSSDCAAVLVACNMLTDNPFTLKELEQMGAELGSDVPFFFYCGTALCKGRGEQVLPIKDIPSQRFYLATSQISVSTRNIYENLNLALTNPQNSTRLLTMLRAGRAPEINACLFNRLEKTAFTTTPMLSAACTHLRQFNYPWLRMTGSGSSMFQLVEDEHEGGDAEKSELFNINGCCWDLALVRSSPLLSLR